VKHQGKIFFDVSYVLIKFFNLLFRPQAQKKNQWFLCLSQEVVIKISFFVQCFTENICSCITSPAKRAGRQKNLEYCHTGKVFPEKGKSLFMLSGCDF
jgi:hypothetical protein